MRTSNREFHVSHVSLTSGVSRTRPPQAGERGVSMTRKFLPLLLSTSAAALILGGLGASATRAADIAFGAFQTFSDDSVILNPGATGYAVNDGSGATTLTTTNNITFVPESSSNVVVTPAVSGDTVKSSTSFGSKVNGSAALGDSNFYSVLELGHYIGTPADALDVTFNGLTAGTNYEVQLFFMDTRQNSTYYEEVMNTDNTGASVGQYGFNTTAATGSPYPSGIPVGAYVTGTFTADASTQSLLIYGSKTSIAPGGTITSPDDAQLNASVLAVAATTPEPATLAMLGIAGASLLLLRRRKSA
jgi:hypothetical protein